MEPKTQQPPYQADLRTQMEYAAKDPTSDFARQLKAYIQMGKADEEAAQLGINLAPFGRGAAQPSPEKQSTVPNVKENSVPLFPGQELGKAVGTSAFGIGQAALRAWKGDTTGALEALSSAASENKKNYGRIVGDTARAVALPASFALPIPKTVLGAGIQGAEIGAMLSAGASLGKGGDLRDAVQAAFIGGVTGGALGAGAKVLSNALTQAGERGPKAMYDIALSIQKRLKTTGKSPSKFLIEEGVWGDLGKFKRSAIEGIATENANIASKLNSSKAATDIVYNADVRAEALKLLQKEMGNLYSKEQLMTFIDDVPVAGLGGAEGVSLAQANKVRSQLGSFIGDNKWIQLQPTEKTQAAQAMYRALRKIVQSRTGTEVEFARLSQWIKTDQAVENALAIADNKFKLGLTDIISGIAGGSVGAFGGQPIPGALLGAVLTRAAQSVPAQTGMAQLLKNIDKLPIDTAGKVSRTAVLELIARLSSDAQGQSEQ